ncbi:MAG: DUF167 family protein [Candidatus Bathyarchaeota archaeon]|nr:DUF167 family protein [Candidatus Bathyarchaeota archaeon]
MKLTQTKDGAVIEVYVKPNSQKFQVSVEDDEIVVRCTEEPEKGKVNREIMKELTKRFHATVEIASGATSRQKRLLIKGVKKEEVERFLSEK